MLKTSILFQGKTTHNEWECYQWLITINSVSFEYRTGLGHGVLKRGKPKGQRQTIWDSECINKRPKDSVDAGDSWAVIPKVDDVLNCLFSDALAGSESFNNFCDNFGYSQDSIKALDIYRACMESGSKLRRALGSEYENERLRIEKLEL